MKKVLSSFIAAVLISSAIYIPNTSSAASSDVLTINLDNRMINLDTKAVMKNETPYLPIYLTKTWAGVKLNWNQKSKEVTIKVDGKTYRIKNGSNAVVAGEQTITLDNPVYIVNGRVMIPSSLLQQMTGVNVQLNEEYRTLTINSKGRSPVAVADTRTDIKLFGKNVKDGLYHGLELEIDGKRHLYNWKTPLGWKEVPELLVNDLDQDGEPEVIVLLNQGSGTGIHAQDVHVIRMKDFKEIPVESQEETIKKWVTTELKKDGDLLQVSVHLKGKGSDVSLRIPGLEFVNESEMWFGGVIYHRAQNNQLIASLGGSVYFSGVYIGNLDITYAFEQGQLVADKLEFTPFDEYKPYVQEQN
ncbi:copper amine oxidase N-terminal domain-containing protein [Paenibacillus dakarensis]|uniref:copper amine oxidase N-terminal domain-containing protein n=1 Tax=Paenibacillus dakarensis TaxID=1527293 RepID=UPI0006D54EE2|nr:copper amine oxidase N-terminal domain-containing protein [Paenibacillus dakarensis]